MSDNDQQQQFPRLALSDLLVLTAAVGIALACAIPTTRQLSQESFTAIEIAPAVIHYVAVGILLFGLILLSRERIRGNRHVPSSPGHWLIVATGPVGAWLLVSSAFPRLIGSGFRFPCTIAVIFVSLGLSLNGLRRTEWRWRIVLAFVFCWLGVFAAIFANLAGALPAYSFAITIKESAYLLAGAAIVLAVAVDALRGLHRDWLHFLALVAYEMSAGTTLVNHGGFLIRWWRDLFFYLLP